MSDQRGRRALALTLPVARSAERDEIDELYLVCRGRSCTVESR